LKKLFSYSVTALLLTTLFVFAAANNHIQLLHERFVEEVSLKTDSLGELESVIELQNIIPPATTPQNPDDNLKPNGVRLKPPDNHKYSAEYDPATGLVTIYQRIGNMSVKLPYTMTLDQYNGSNAININAQGIAEVSLGIKNTKIENPTLQERQRNITTFDFQQKIQINLRGSIGERLKIGMK